MYQTKTCPIEYTFNNIGKKWAINIIRDLTLGRKRFSEFLEANPKMSAKMLSQRLKELEDGGIIEKTIVGKRPVKIEYALTKTGEDLKKVLKELAVFSMKNFTKNVIKNPPKEYDDYAGRLTADKKLGISQT